MADMPEGTVIDDVELSDPIYNIGVVTQLTIVKRFASGHTIFVFYSVLTERPCPRPHSPSIQR